MNMKKRREEWESIVPGDDVMSDTNMGGVYETHQCLGNPHAIVKPGEVGKVVAKVDGIAYVIFSHCAGWFLVNCHLPVKAY